LWLVRHGETTANASRTISGWTDVPLTKKGEEQARAAKQWLEGTSFESVWSSDLHRAVSTSRLAWGEPKIDRRIREMHFGRIENRQFEEIDPHYRETLMEFVDFEAPGGEKMYDFKRRLLEFVKQLRPGRHLLLTHGGVIRALTQNLGEDRFVSNGGLVTVDWTAQEILCVRESDI
jgi:probable phosphoglycerate mutase